MGMYVPIQSAIGHRSILGLQIPNRKDSLTAFHPTVAGERTMVRCRHVMEYNAAKNHAGTVMKYQVGLKRTLVATKTANQTIAVG